MLVGEALWESGRLTAAALEQMIHNSRQLPQDREEGWTVEQILFGREPFGEEIQAAAAASGVRVITLAEIEPFLLAARARLRWERQNPSPIEIEF